MNLNQKIIKPKLGLLELAKSLGRGDAVKRRISYAKERLINSKFTCRSQDLILQTL